MKKKIEIWAHLCAMAMMITLVILTLSGSPVQGKRKSNSAVTAQSQTCVDGGDCPPYTCFNGLLGL
jgi:hypothetical protein